VSAATILAWAILPESLLHTQWYAVLSGFVAINTILYVSLSVFKILPKVYVHDYIQHRGRRAETRSIYPNGSGPPAAYVPVPGSLAAQHEAWLKTNRGPTRTSGSDPHGDSHGSHAATRLASLLEAELDPS
jgi:hypothetical protein